MAQRHYLQALRLFFETSTVLSFAFIHCLKFSSPEEMDLHRRYFLPELIHTLHSCFCATLGDWLRAILGKGSGFLISASGM